MTVEAELTHLTEARLAQSVEHETLNLRVVGSSPTLGENFIMKYINKVEIVLFYNIYIIFVG